MDKKKHSGIFIINMNKIAYMSYTCVGNTNESAFFYRDIENHSLYAWMNNEWKLKVDE